MSSVLADKIRKSREFTIEVEGHKLTARRPTDDEAALMRAESLASVARKFVIDWDFTQKDLPDLFEKPTDEAVFFSQDLWVEVVVDKPKWWAPITKAVHDKYKEFVKQRAEAEKK